MAAPQDKFYQAPDGLSLHYVDYGAAGPSHPVICLPGLTRNARDFIDLATHLSPGLRVVCPDLRGRGRSDHDDNADHYQPATYAADVFALMDVLGVDKAVLVGTSLGGIVAMTMAAINKERLAGVVINDAGPVIELAGIMRIASYVGAAAPASTWAEAAESCRAMTGVAFPDFGQDDWTEFARRTYRENADGTLAPDYDPRIAEPFKQAGVPDPEVMWGLFGALADVPALLVRGAISDILSAETAAQMRQAKADLEFIEVPGRGHAPTLTEAAVLGPLSDFVTKCARR